MRNKLAAPVEQKLYVKIPNCIGLYRHSVTNRYYGVKKVNGKRREVSLKTTDRKIAERRLKEWIGNLDKVNTEVERTTLRDLVQKFLEINQGKSESTQDWNLIICRSLERTWKRGMDIEVRDIKPSYLDEWLAMHERRLRNTSYNKWAGFLKQLFEIAVNDRIIAESPFEKVTTRWKRPQTPVRRIPTMEQYQAIISAVRSQPFTDHAEDSGDLLEFEAMAALGQAEASALTWGDVDWKRGYIQVRRRKTGTPFRVPIYPHLRPILERLKNRAGKKVAPEVRVLKINDAKKGLKAACERLRLPNFTQRSLRQFGIGLLWRAGISPKLIAKWQGHVDGGQLIIDTYTEVFSDDDRLYEQQQLAKLFPAGEAQPASSPLDSEVKMALVHSPTLPAAAKPLSAGAKSVEMENPFKADATVMTRIKGVEVEVTVKQIWKREVQVKAPDGKLLWRTMYTVWFPGLGPIPKPEVPVPSALPSASVENGSGGEPPTPGPGKPSTIDDIDAEANGRPNVKAGRKRPAGKRKGRATAK